MQEIKIFDLHVDLPTANFENKLQIAKENEERGYRAINAIYRGHKNFEICFNLAESFARQGLAIAFEDASFEDFFISEGKIDSERILLLADKLCSLSPLYVSLGWNYSNYFCGGCAEAGGLTEEGKFFISRLNENKVAVDLAHMNKESFFDALEISDRPICSHTAFEWIYPHRRNVDKEQVRYLLQKGGVIGVIGVGHFLSGIKGRDKNFENAYYIHIASYLDNFGEKGLCVGSDFYGSDAPVYKDGDYSFIERFESNLQDKGVSNGVIEKILHKNATEFFFKS